MPIQKYRYKHKHFISKRKNRILQGKPAHDTNTCELCHQSDGIEQNYATVQHYRILDDLGHPRTKGGIYTESWPFSNVS